MPKSGAPHVGGGVSPPRFDVLLVKGLVELLFLVIFVHFDVCRSISKLRFVDLSSCWLTLHEDDVLVQ